MQSLRSLSGTQKLVLFCEDNWFLGVILKLEVIREVWLAGIPNAGNLDSFEGERHPPGEDLILTKRYNNNTKIRFVLEGVTMWFAAACLVLSVSLPNCLLRDDLVQARSSLSGVPAQSKLAERTKSKQTKPKQDRKKTCEALLVDLEKHLNNFVKTWKASRDPVVYGRHLLSAQRVVKALERLPLTAFQTKKCAKPKCLPQKSKQEGKAPDKKRLEKFLGGTYQRPDPKEMKARILRRKKMQEHCQRLMKLVDVIDCWADTKGTKATQTVLSSVDEMKATIQKIRRLCQGKDPKSPKGKESPEASK